MADDNIFRRLRAGLGNALVLGVGWFAAAFAVFAALPIGGVAAACSLNLAQSADTLLPGGSQGQLDRLESVDRLASMGEWDSPITQRSRSTQC